MGFYNKTWIKAIMAEMAETTSPKKEAAYNDIAYNNMWVYGLNLKVPVIEYRDWEMEKTTEQLRYCKGV